MVVCWTKPGKAKERKELGAGWEDGPPPSTVVPCPGPGPFRRGKAEKTGKDRERADKRKEVARSTQKQLPHALPWRRPAHRSYLLGHDSKHPMVCWVPKSSQRRGVLEALGLLSKAETKKHSH